MSVDLGYVSTMVVASSSLARILGECSTIQSTMAQPAKTTVAECSLASCVWVPLRIGSTLCLDSGIVSPLRLRWVNDWGLLTCHSSNTGLERTPNKSQHTNLTLEKKILPPLMQGFEFATLRLRVRLSTNAYTSYPGSPARYECQPRLRKATQGSHKYKWVST